jgi:hypothetical protein
VRYLGNATHDPPVIVITTSWPLAVTVSIGVSDPAVRGDARLASMLNFTAAPSRGVPSWNVMPSRMCRVHSV